jgi:hypothetical protein
MVITVAQLKELAREIGAPLRAGMKKDEILAEMKKVITKNWKANEIAREFLNTRKLTLDKDSDLFPPLSKADIANRKANKAYYDAIEGKKPAATTVYDDADDDEEEEEEDDDDDDDDDDDGDCKGRNCKVIKTKPVSHKPKKVSKPVSPKQSKPELKPLVTPTYIKPEPVRFKRIELVGLNLTPKAQTIRQITAVDFEKLIQTPAFIQRYLSSIETYNKIKLAMYQKKHATLNEDLEQVKRKLEKQKKKEKKPDDKTLADYVITLETVIDEINDILKILTESKPTAVDIRRSLMKAFFDADDGLYTLEGREDVHNRIAQQLYAFSRNPKTMLGFNNMAILGPAGTGKTKMATVLGFVYSHAGVLARNKVKIVSRADLVASHVGRTGPKTQRALFETLEGILFIDEAYQLSPCKTSESNDFGPEAVTEIVNFLDKYVGMSIVIVAGYEKPIMDCFFGGNEGLKRRFPIIIVLQPYDIEQLTKILLIFLKQRDAPTFSAEEKNTIYSLVDFISNHYPNVFKNQAGDMLNLSLIHI